jgi:hypothetical protein
VTCISSKNGSVVWWYVIPGSEVVLRWKYKGTLSASGSAFVLFDNALFGCEPANLFLWLLVGLLLCCGHQRAVPLSVISDVFRCGVLALFVSVSPCVVVYLSTSGPRTIALQVSRQVRP